MVCARLQDDPALIDIDKAVKRLDVLEKIVLDLVLNRHWIGRVRKNDKVYILKKRDLNELT